MPIARPQVAAKTIHLALNNITLTREARQQYPTLHVMFANKVTGITRGTHRIQSNKKLLSYLISGHPIGGIVSRELNIPIADIITHMQSGKNGNLRNPPGCHWHHPKFTETHLVTKKTHQDPAFQSILHPNGVGGIGKKFNLKGKYHENTR